MKTERKALFISLGIIIAMFIDGLLIHAIWPKFTIEVILLGVFFQLIVFAVIFGSVLLILDTMEL